MTYALCDHICTEQTDRHVCQYVADDLEHVVRYADRERSRFELGDWSDGTLVIWHCTASGEREVAVVYPEREVAIVDRADQRHHTSLLAALETLTIYDEGVRR